MKVCFLVGTLGRGGAEKQLVLMLRALARAGVATRVLCLTRGEAYESEIAALGVPIEWVGARAGRGRRLLTIAASLRRAPADIVQSSHFYTNIYAGLAGRALGAKSIGAIRNDFTSEVAAHGFLGKYQVSLPSFLIANSEISCRRAIEGGVSPRKIEFVRNAVETDDAAQARPPKDELVVLLVGRLERQKRVERFVELAAALAARFPDRALRFEIAGDGAERASLEARAAALGLGDRLEFLGRRASLEDVYRRADLLVSTSDFEGTPNAVLEAMAHGLPVVATRVGGTGEIVNATRGVLVEAGDAHALAAAAARLVADESLRRGLGANARRYVAEHHSLAALEKRLTAIYERLLAGGAR